MFALTRIVFFVLPASALIAHPLTTPPPSLKARQVVETICGYFQTDASINPFSCTEIPSADTTSPAQSDSSNNTSTTVAIVFAFIAVVAIAITISVCCCMSKHTRTTPTMSNTNGEPRPGGRLSKCAKFSAIGSFVIAVISLAITFTHL